MVRFIEYSFYTIDANYLEYLNKIDSEVYYNPSYKNNIKPFIGLVVGIENYNYFIPISSVKEKHKKWKNVSDEHFLIYEIIDNSINLENNIYKYYSPTKKIHLLSVLDIKKMIPVPNGCYKKIDFKNITDMKYKNLFEKEYVFCLSIKEKILKRVETIYKKQKNTKIVKRLHCNFSLLEKAMLEWEVECITSNEY